MSALTQKFVVIAALTLACLTPNLASAQFERDPEVIQAFEAGKAAMMAEDWEGALAAFDAAIAKDDDTFAELFFGRAEALRELEDYQTAIKSYTESIRLDDSFAQGYNGRGICYREEGNLQMAFNDFYNAAELDRRNGSIAANLGDILINNPQPNPTEAMQYLDRAIESNPEDSEAYRNRGYAHALLRDYEEGIVDLQKAIELDPADYETYEKLASVYQAEEEHVPSIEAVSKAIEHYEPEDSSEPDIYINGYLRRANSRLILAKEADTSDELRADLYSHVVEDSNVVLDEYPDRFPESGIAYFRLGIAKRLQGSFAEAIMAFTDAIQVIPPGTDSNYTVDAYLFRGICWFYQGQNSLARGDFKEAASKSLADPRPYLWIGYTQAEEGEYRKAIESYGEAAARNPNYALAHINRGLAYMQLKDYSKAIDNFNEAIQAEPTEAKHYYKNARAHELLGEPQKALDFYNLALHSNEQFVEAHQGAARVLRILGRPGLAEIEESKANALP